MLQETHRALIASNQTLMTQLQQAKKAHADEVGQMHRNFEALKRLHARGDGAADADRPSPPARDAAGARTRPSKAGGAGGGAKPAAARRVLGPAATPME